MLLGEVNEAMQQIGAATRPKTSMHWSALAKSPCGHNINAGDHRFSENFNLKHLNEAARPRHLPLQEGNAPGTYKALPTTSPIPGGKGSPSPR
jgi:hypothetical protein